MSIKKIEEKSRQHTVYKNRSGGRIVGVTTIVGVMNKPALVKWANGMGLKGIDTTTLVDQLSGVGSCAHAMVTESLQGREADTGEFSKDQISLAETCAIKWHYWADNHKILPIFCEKPMVSETFQFGGTCDIYCELDGKKTLIDLKTCKGIYDEMETQVSAYRSLLVENGHPVDQCLIVRIGRSEDEGTQPEVREIANVDLHWKRFLACLNLYRINQQIRKEG